MVGHRGNGIVRGEGAGHQAQERLGVGIWDEKQKQFAHATGLVVATPQGVVSRYFFGIEYAPKELRLGLVEATNGRLGSVVDQLLLAGSLERISRPRQAERSCSLDVPKVGLLLLVGQEAGFEGVAGQRSHFRFLQPEGGGDR